MPPLITHALPSDADISRSHEEVQHLLKNQFRRASAPHLPDDFAGNMRGQRPGNQSPHMYGLSAMPFWRRIVQTKIYYPAFSDFEIIEKRKKELRGFSDELNSKGDVTLVVMGVGDEFAIEFKTWALAKIFKAKTIVLVDFSETALHAAAFYLGQLAEKEGVAIDLVTRQRDYNKENFDISTEGPRVFEQLGVAYGNMEGPAEMSVVDTTRILTGHMRKQMNPGDLAFISVDRNTDRKSLLKAYKTPEFMGWVDHHRVHLGKNFYNVGYNPDNYVNDDVNIWDEKNLLLTFGTVAQKAGLIDLNQDPVTFGARKHKPILYQKGQKNVFLNSRRFEQVKLTEGYNAAQGTCPNDKVKLVYVLEDHFGFIGWQTLQAIKEKPKAPSCV